MKKQFLMVAALLSAFVLSACSSGGGDAPPSSVATNDVVLGVTSTTGRSVARSIDDEVFTFSGVPALGTNATTTVSVNGDGTAPPTFTVTEAGGGNATGVLSFGTTPGTCIFTVTQSTFSSSAALGVGKTVEVDQCQVNIATAGTPANGTTQERNATLRLRNAVSLPLTVTVAIGSAGQVTVNSEPSGVVATTNDASASGG